MLYLQFNHIKKCSTDFCTVITLISTSYKSKHFCTHAISFTWGTSNISNTAESCEEMLDKTATLWNPVKVLGWETWTDRHAVAVDKKQKRTEAAEKDTKATKSWKRRQPWVRYWARFLNILQSSALRKHKEKISRRAWQ